MSSLVFGLTEDFAYVATDTLATDLDGNPVFLTSKALPLPHLNMIVATTGTVGFMGRWVTYINDSFRTSGISDFNRMAQGELNNIFKQLVEAGDITKDSLISVVHIGFSEESNKVIGYSYQAFDGFTPRPLKYNVPYYRPNEENLDGLSIPNDITKIMETQISNQIGNCSSETTYIGGEIIEITLTTDGFTITKNKPLSNYSEIYDRLFPKLN